MIWYVMMWIWIKTQLGFDIQIADKSGSNSSGPTGCAVVVHPYCLWWTNNILPTQKKTNISGWFGLVNFWRHFTPGSTAVAYYIQTPKARVDESVAMESPFESPPKKNGRPSRLNGWFYIGKWYSSQPSSDGHPELFLEVDKIPRCGGLHQQGAPPCDRLCQKWKVSMLWPFLGWRWKWCFKH